MAIMPAKTYAAFKAAGVSDAEAEAAAEEIAAFENRLAKSNAIWFLSSGCLASLPVVLPGFMLWLDRVSGCWRALLPRSALSGKGKAGSRYHGCQRTRRRRRKACLTIAA
jgi:hypothetical protein